MSSKSMRMTLLVAVLALMPGVLQAQPAANAVAPEPSSSRLDVPIREIAASSNGSAILDKDFPGMLEHPMYGAFKALSLNQVAAMSHGEITPNMLAQAQTDLSALAPVAASVPPQTDVQNPNTTLAATHLSFSGAHQK